MKQVSIFAILFISTISCGSGLDEQEAIIKEDIDTMIIEEGNTDEEIEEDDCTRSIPEPVADEKIRQSFELVDRVGTEKCNLPSGPSVTIINSGCEAYVLSFYILVDDWSHAGEEEVAWLPDVIKYLRELEPYIDAPIRMAAGIDALEKNGGFYEEISYGDDIIGNFVMFESVTDIQEGFEFGIKFYTGAL